MTLFKKKIIRKDGVRNFMNSQIKFLTFEKYKKIITLKKKNLDDFKKNFVKDFKTQRNLNYENFKTLKNSIERSIKIR